MRPRSIFPNSSPLRTPMLPRIRALSMVRTWSQSARESLDRRVSFAASKGWTKRSAGLPCTDESGTTVTVEEMSLASVLETIMHGRVLGTSAPRAGSSLTHTKEPLTTKASLRYRREQIFGLFGATLAGRNGIPLPTEPSTLFDCVGLSNPPNSYLGGHSK